MPGAGPAIKVGAYAIQGAVALGLYGNIFRQWGEERQQKQLQESEISPYYGDSAGQPLLCS